MTQDMKHNDMKRNNEMRAIVFTTRRHYGFCGRLLRMFLLLMMVIGGGVNSVWADGYEGVKYIASDGNAASVSNKGTAETYSYSVGDSENFYLVPTSEPASQTDKSDVYNDGTGAQKPFLTTYKIGQDKEAVWVLKQVTDNDGTFYYVIHAMTGKYVVFDPFYSGYSNASSSGNWRRKCMHLQAIESLTENESLTEKAKFVIEERNSAYCFIPKEFRNITPNNTNTYIFWNIADKNRNSRQGLDASNYWGGLVGLYCLASKSTALDANSRWKFESTLLDAPTISDVSAFSTITITDANSLPEGYTIRYTTDGTGPTATSTEYSGPIDITSSCTVKAVVVRYGIVLTNIASKSVSPVIVAPTVTNNYDGTISLSSTTPNAKIYYTTNGTTPSSSNGTLYENTPFSLGNTTVIKAITYNSDLSESSEVTTYNVPQYTAPTISFNSSTSQVTITSEGTVYYNTGDGSQADPTTSSTEYSTPFTVSSATTIKAIATHAGYLTSEVASLAITQVAMPTIQNNGSNAVSITCATEGATIYYTTDGSTPTTSSTQYTAPLTEGVSGVTIKAIAVKENMINSEVGSGSVTLQCAAPVIVRNGNTGFTVTCPFPASGVTIYYTTDGSIPTTSSSSTTSGGTVTAALPVTVKAMAVATNYSNSSVATVPLSTGMGGDGSAANPYTIEYQSDVSDFITKANTADGASKHYKVTATTSLDFSSVDAIIEPFTGTFDGGLQTISGLDHALFNTVDGGRVKNVILKDVNISTGTNVGAIANEATGASRIYNCGILPTTVLRNDPDDEDKITGFSGSTIGGSNNVGGIVGLLSYNARVINCYSYATITGGATVAGIVGNIGYDANGTITQDDVATKPMVVNCMFYGDITGGTSKSPVYGGANGAMIKNDAAKGVNPYCYYRKNASFDNTYDDINYYKRSWPAEEKNLTRFEYYRSILNSNKRLCTYWVTNKVYGSDTNAPTEADEALIAKWVLDPTIAPYPILKKWGKYPSVINHDPQNRYDLSTNSWVSRSTANEWEGKQLGTLNVTINPGNHAASGVATKSSVSFVITDMDTLNCDYGYYKIQLPYYNEQFGDPEAPVSQWDKRYGGNYKDWVVTGWEITVSGGTNSFANYNFADRDCTTKDNYASNGRIFAQGGYYYVPNNVSSITITAHWGKAVYLANRGFSIDRVNVTNAGYKADSPFTPAGTIGETFQEQTVYSDWQGAMAALPTTTTSVYDQAIVLIGNHQVKNGSTDVSNKITSDEWKGFTMMSADLDFDNEPDNCFMLQFRHDVERLPIQPIRFDFLPIVELGLAVRHDSKAYAIGIMVPQGHFEITETAFMRTTQFEYDGFQKGTTSSRVSGKSPMILNGGEFESFSVRYHNSDRTSYFLLGGNVWVHRFAPGAHPSAGAGIRVYLCPVNAIGGEYPEFYMSGLFKAGQTTPDGQEANCYTNGGKFGVMAGAGYEKIKGGATFKVNHSLIKEFYGGGINATNPLDGNINVTINYSHVNKYCGGPKVGNMTGKTVTTNATGTTFDLFYGGGNGGNSYYRDGQDDGDWNTSDITNDEGLINDWNHRNYHWDDFSALGANDNDKGYHAEYEFEVFNQSNGVNDQITQRGYIKWIQFGITTTGNVSNTLTNCTIKENFYGGGNLATVNGTVSSTLTNTIVWGNVFGAGFSATIPKFSVHEKDTKVFPSIDKSGTITDGNIDYKRDADDGNKIIEYEWTNDLNGETLENRKNNPAYKKDGKWYCYTWNSLDNLGAVLNQVTLTLNGKDGKRTVVGTANKTGSGNVYGGGDMSVVSNTTSPEAAAAASTIVTLKGDTEILGNVFGGGNNGEVSGSATVNIEYDE